MTIDPSYFRYLEHFPRAVRLRDVTDPQSQPNVLALRHDIDHDLDLALDMAYHEHEHGVHATYFLLHTADYWDDPQLGAKCRQLEAYGHEVGLHVNVLTEWVNGRCRCVGARLDDLLGRLRGYGITVNGVSAHGDRACYTHGYVNTWIWRELRPDDPAASQQRLCAEGIPTAADDRTIRYPQDHQLRCDDGRTYPLWRESLRDRGLSYDAVHLPAMRYWTDSGGNWSRRGDPIKADLSRGRHQTLIHPEWWRGPQRSIFFASTARAGTAWLTNSLDRATSARALHEWTLNRRRNDPPNPTTKRTTTDLQRLVDEPQAAERLVRDSVAFKRSLSSDVIEANAYIEPFLELLQTIDPDTIIVHLHRDGRDIVRSILRRGWYDTPNDHRHRRTDHEHWGMLSQFERACSYVEFTNRRIAPFSRGRLCFERMVNDRNYLIEAMRSLDIVIHPLLLDGAFDNRINSSPRDSIDDDDGEPWSADEETYFAQICGRLQRELGYAAESVSDASRRPLSGRSPYTSPRLILEYNGDRCPWRYTPVHASAHSSEHGLCLAASELQRPSAHVILANGSWHHLERRHGSRGRPGFWYSAVLHATLPDSMSVRVFVLFFARSGHQILKMHVATLRGAERTTRFSFAAIPAATHFALALHLGGQSNQLEATIHRITVHGAPLPTGYRAIPQDVSHARHVANHPHSRAGLADVDDGAQSSLSRLPADLRAEQRRCFALKKRYDVAQYEQLLAPYLSDHMNLTLAEFVRTPPASEAPILLIRHDIDHDVETALAMAEWEHGRGIRATYCVLHTAWYYSQVIEGQDARTADLAQLVRTIHGLGHEISLHNNVVALALRTGADPAEVLASELRFLRGLGVPITGTCTHGDRLCREMNFGNFEIFAEAVQDKRGGPRTLQTEHGAVRLGSLRYADFNLDYEAYDIARDVYSTDSGGALRSHRNAAGRGRFAHNSARAPIVGILTHPIWWRFPEPATASDAITVSASHAGCLV